MRAPGVGQNAGRLSSARGRRSATWPGLSWGTMAGMGERSGAVTATVEGRDLVLTNLEKVLYPAAGFTKGQVADYYRRIAPVLLPHLRGRPVTLKRYPNGVREKPFFQKALPARRPEWVRVAPVWSETSHREVPFCVCDDLPTLVWLANLAALELHPLQSRADDLDRPTCAVFDLDPGPPAGIAECCRVALWLRERFEGWGLRAFPKTSGSRGLHVFVPLNTSVTHAETKAFAHEAAVALATEHRGEVVSNMRRSLRSGRVLIDWSQNARHKTTVAVYSLRGRERPTVSTPITWDEVEAGAAGRDALVFEPADVLARVEESGDLFEPVLTLRQRLAQPG